MNKQEDKYFKRLITILLVGVVLIMALGITHNYIKSNADSYDEFEVIICNDMKALAWQYQKITAIDYNKKYFKDECIVYINKKQYDAHEFIKLVGLEQISILDDAESLRSEVKEQ